MKKIIIDVREKEEYASEHIEDSISLPLTELARQAPGVIKNLPESTVVLMCRSGKRAELAKNQLDAMKLKRTFEIYPGGILEWKKQNKPTQCLGPSVFPIMRQVQLVAGFLVVLGVTLSFLVNSNWIFLSAFIGAGLMFAGATGFCGMAKLLGVMPWNRCR